jgi:hypothetical protein
MNGMYAGFITTVHSNLKDLHLIMRIHTYIHKGTNAEYMYNKRVSTETWTCHLNIFVTPSVP